MPRPTQRDVVKALGWAAAPKLLVQPLTFGVGVVLARLLSPEDFGLVGMVTVLSGFSLMFVDSGFASALIQRDTITDRETSSVFWLNLGVGSALAVLIAALAPLVASFYKEPELLMLTRAVALQFVLSALAVVPAALLRRDLAFKALGLRDVAAAVAGGGVAVVMALSGYGVWSLIGQILVNALATAVLVWAACPWRPRWTFDWAAVRDLLGFSGNVLGFNVINYWTRNADYLIIGRVIGAASLGLYTRAYQTMMLPITQLTGKLSSVLFPAMARYQDDLPRLKRGYLRAIGITGLITIPLMVGLFILADPFVRAVYTDKWAGVVPILQILCLVGIKQPLGSITGVLYLSQGRADLQFRWNLVINVSAVAAFAMGAQWGVLGVAIAYAIHQYVFWYPSIRIPGALIGVSFYDFVRSISGVIACSALMATAMLGVDRFVGDWSSPWIALLSLTAVGVGVFGSAAATFQLKPYREALSILRGHVVS